MSLKNPPKAPEKPHEIKVDETDAADLQMRDAATGCSYVKTVLEHELQTET